MTTNDLTPGLSALQAQIGRAFDHFNNTFWEGKLPRPLVLFHPNPPNGKTLGHYWPQVWTQDKKRGDEIVFYSDLCLSAGWNQIAQTLLHEMVHLWQQYNGSPGKNNFHNAQWHAECERVGLKTEGPKGYTKSTQAFQNELKKIRTTLDGIPFRSVPGGKGKTKGKMKKWVCDCGFGVRVAVPNFNAVCQDCDTEFRLEE